MDLDHNCRTQVGPKTPEDRSSGYGQSAVLSVPTKTPLTSCHANLSSVTLPSVEMALDHVRPEIASPFKLPYDTVIAAFNTSGGWRVAADLYKSWAKNQVLVDLWVCWGKRGQP